jgi:hypothetical protein
MPNAVPSRAFFGVSALVFATATAITIIGVMDLRAMAVVTAAITAERLAPTGRRVVHAIGAVAVVAGLLAIARAAWLA